MNNYIDHTLLRSSATVEEIAKLCQEAKEYEFFSVCLNPAYIEVAKQYLQDSNVKVCTVIGFPLGANTIETKVFETRNAIILGADEVDMVINIGQAKANNFTYIYEEIKEVVNAADHKTVKVILETSELTNEQIVNCTKMAVQAKATFVKTSTGFSSAGATIEHIRLMKSVCDENTFVKASGGIRDLQAAEQMIAAGASRLGVSSGVKIMKQLRNEEINDENTNSAY